MHKTIAECFQGFKNKDLLKEFFTDEFNKWERQIHHYFADGVNYVEFNKFINDFKEIINLSNNNNFIVDLFNFYDENDFPTYSHFNQVLSSQIGHSYPGAGANYLLFLSNKGKIKLSSISRNNGYFRAEFDIAKNEINDSKNLSLAPALAAITECRLNDVLIKLKQYEEDFNKIKSSAEISYKDFTTDIEKKFEEKVLNLQSAVEDKFKLHASVTYWRAKSSRHQFASYAVLLSLVATLCGFGGLIWIGISYYLNNYSLLMENSEKFKFLDGHIKYLLLGVSFTLFVWLIRVYLKIWLSQMHMRNDADERVVMVQTYLALLADGAVQNKEDRSFVINALFRSASDGIVKDDGMPNPIIELITKSR